MFVVMDKSARIQCGKVPRSPARGRRRRSKSQPLQFRSRAVSFCTSSGPIAPKTVIEGSSRGIASRERGRSRMAPTPRAGPNKSQPAVSDFPCGSSMTREKAMSEVKVASKTKAENGPGQ
jgi:hypothetical protein